VPYKYVGGDDAQLLRGFSAREPVRVRGRIKFDNEGVPSAIEGERYVKPKFYMLARG
jgi:hypothetical protein